MTALEQSIATLMEAHNLLNVSISLSSYSEGRSEFCVAFQWKDETKEFGRGISTSYADTIADALAASLAKMAEKRAPALANEALPSLAA